MYLIANDADVVTPTDVAHALQLIAMPDTTCRVMRITKQEDGGLLVGTAHLEVCPVHLKAVVAVTELQHAFADLTATVTDATEKTIVVGAEHDNFLASHREGLQGTRHGRNNTDSI